MVPDITIQGQVVTFCLGTVFASALWMIALIILFRKSMSDGGDG